MLKYIKLAWRNMWRNWRRTAIALIAIVLGLMLLLLMDGMIKGSDQAVFGNAVRLYGGNIQVHAPGFMERASRLPLLPLADADAVVAAAMAQPDVVNAAKRINTGGMITSREGTYALTVTGIEPSVEARTSIQAENVVDGRYLVDEDLDAVFVGRGLANLLNTEVGDQVTLLGTAAHEQMRQRTMTVVGIYDVGAPDIEKAVAFISLPEAQALYDLRGQATEVSITLEKVGQEDRVATALRAALPGYEVDTWDTLRPEIRQALDSKSVITGFFGFIVVFIACIGVLNLMMMAVFERTREMGVLAALGMKGNQIMGLYLLEGAMIGLVGAVLGCALGLGVNWLIAQLGGINFGEIADMGEVTALMGTHLIPTYSLSDAIRQGATVVVIAALASLYPAWQASRAEPAEALHHV
jgi:ABC-type lipoprotein release transport system permease subunit